MDDYVRRGDVLDIAMQYCPDDDGSCSKADADPREMLDEIEALPSADVQLVKHGRWLDNGIVYTCSECNSSVPKNIFVIGCDFEGCPYCFSRMDGDSE